MTEERKIELKVMARERANIIVMRRHKDEYEKLWRGIWYRLKRKEGKSALQD